MLFRPTEERSARDRGFRRFRPRELDHIGREDHLDGLGLPETRPTQRLDRIGAEYLPDTLRLLWLNGPEGPVFPSAPGGLRAPRGAPVTLPPGGRNGDLGPL